jgi:hypothetical protein
MGIIGIGMADPLRPRGMGVLIGSCEPHQPRVGGADRFRWAGERAASRGGVHDLGGDRGDDAVPADPEEQGAAQGGRGCWVAGCPPAVPGEVGRGASLSAPLPAHSELDPLTNAIDCHYDGVIASNERASH